MVLERLISIRDAVRNPWWMFVIGAIVSLVSLLVSYLVFAQEFGLFTTILITFAMSPFIVNLNIYEEAKEEELIARRKRIGFFAMHREILMVYIAFFVGVITALTLVFLLFPEAQIQSLFESQLNTIKLIRGSSVIADTFERILINNLGVLFLAYLFSFLFGAGAIFILTWNASVLATAIGLLAKSYGGLISLPAAVLFYFPHASLEMLAYFISGIAGGLVSASLTRKKSRWFWLVVKDSLMLVFVSVVILVVAAVIESVRIAYQV